MTRIRRFLVVPALVLAASGLFAAWWVRAYVLTPWKGWSGETAIVEIPKGEGANRIFARLEDSGVVRASFAARLVHRFRLAGRQLKAGEYEFTAAATPEEVLRKIADGRARQYSVTIREGLDRWQVAAELAKGLPWLDPDEIADVIANPAPIRDLDPEAKDLEGYLFPDTYAFTRGTEEVDVVDRILRNFRLRWEVAVAKAGPPPEGSSLHEILVLASLVEAETGAPAERPRIAAVFRNRLRIGMPLQCDPTVIYAMKRDGRWKGNIRKTDLSAENPYNTYVNRGLPPGPIGNPGLAALEAVLAPAGTNELYFVSKNDGTHVFSADYASHQAAVEKWQREYWRQKKAADEAAPAEPVADGAGSGASH